MNDILLEEVERKARFLCVYKHQTNKTKHGSDKEGN